MSRIQRTSADGVDNQLKISFANGSYAWCSQRDHPDGPAGRTGGRLERIVERDGTYISEVRMIEL